MVYGPNQWLSGVLEAYQGRYVTNSAIFSQINRVSIGINRQKQSKVGRFTKNRSIFNRTLWAFVWVIWALFRILGHSTGQVFFQLCGTNSSSFGVDISWICGALGPLGLWPKDKAFGLGYGPRSTHWVLGIDLWPVDWAFGPYLRSVVKCIDKWSVAWAF